MTNIDLSKMTHAVFDLSTNEVSVVFPCKTRAEEWCSRRYAPENFKIIPINPPAPKYPKAERPTHCVVNHHGTVCTLGDEPKCVHWKDTYGNKEYFVSTCSHWWTNEGGGQ
jgi:hypothetical protein